MHSHQQMMWVNSALRVFEFWPFAIIWTQRLGTYSPWGGRGWSNPRRLSQGHWKSRG